MSDIIKLTSQIVCAHLQNNKVSVEELPLLIERTHAALAGRSLLITVESVKIEPLPEPLPASETNEPASDFAAAMAKARGHLSGT